MSMILLELEGLELIMKILKNIIENEDVDSPISKRSQTLIDSCTEILENYIGVNNDFSCPTLKSIYHEFLIEVLDDILGKNIFCSLRCKNIKSVQLCVDNDEFILLQVGDINGR